MQKKIVLIVALGLVALVGGVFLGQMSRPGSTAVDEDADVVTDAGPDAGEFPIDTAPETIADVIEEAISDEGIVVQDTGEPVVLDAEPGSAEAPQQSNAIENTEELPENVIQLGITSADGWTPTSFTVQTGALVSLSITSSDDLTHVFAFVDASLSAVAVGVGPGETRVISFNAPAPGEYEYHSNMPGQKQLVGKMIVQ